MAWQDDLQPASWLGLPFYVDTSQGRFGRNKVAHAYPYREKNQMWVEDIGLSGALVHIVGFLIGDDVRQQHLDFFNATQKQVNAGNLVHPVYGSQKGSIVGGVRYTVKRDRGRYVEVEFDFVSHNDTQSTLALPDTKNDVQVAAGNSQAAAASDYQSQTGATAPSSLQQRGNSSINTTTPASTAVA